MATKKSASERSEQESKSSTADDAGEKEMQERFDKASEQGFFGTETDPTDNNNYTLHGVVSGAPTPETDADAARKAREATGLGAGGIERNAKGANE